MIAFLKGKINEVSYYPNRYVRMRLSQNENYLSKSNVILSVAKNLVYISLCIRDPSLRSG